MVYGANHDLQELVSEIVSTTTGGGERPPIDASEAA